MPKPYGAYQEPMPIQYPATRYAPAPAMVPAYSRFPSYPAPVYPSYPPQPGSYAVPRQGPQGSGVMQARAQELAPPASDSGQNAPTSPPDDMAPPPIPDFGVGHDDGAPAEPYMVGPESTWKPRKGYKLYASGDYLYWWVKGQPLPGNLSLSASQPTTLSDLTSQGLSGTRIFLGTWIQRTSRIGLLKAVISFSAQKTVKRIRRRFPQIRTFRTYRSSTASFRNPVLCRRPPICGARKATFATRRSDPPAVATAAISICWAGFASSI